MIVGLVFCVIMSGYFSATETAFTSLNRVRLKSWADGGDQRAARTLALAEDYDKLLSTLLIGNNIVNNVATTIGAVLFIHLIDEVTGPTVSAIVLTVVILIFGEVSPKSLAKESPERFAMFSAPVMRLLLWVLAPVNWIFMQWKKLLSMVFKAQEDKGITEEELLTIVDEAQNDGGIGRPYITYALNEDGTAPKFSDLLGFYPVKKGSSVLLPAGLGAYTVTGEGVQYVVTRVDEKLS